VAVAVHTNSSTQLVCGLYNGSLQFWDCTKKDLVEERPTHLSEVTALSFNSDETVLVSGGADYLINVWDFGKRQIIFEIREYDFFVTSIGILDQLYTLMCWKDK